jgi:GNAT superfamily N-acetyltransferase
LTLRSIDLSEPCIRAATHTDLPRLAELLYQLTQLGEQPDAAPRPVEREVAALEALLADDRATCLVLEAEGRVAGTLTVYVLPNLSHGGDPMAVIENVVVDEAARGRGYGHVLMAAAEQIATAAGCFKIVLTSNRRRLDAHRFYQALDYNPTHQGFTKYLS